MINFTTMVILFFLPGFVAEYYYLSIIGGYVRWEIKDTVRSMCFSVSILLLRCLVSISQGYSDFPLEAVFIGIGNVAKYILLAGVMIFILPNVYFVIHKIILRLSKRFILEDGDREENFDEN